MKQPPKYSMITIPRIHYKNNGYQIQDRVIEHDYWYLKNYKKFTIADVTRWSYEAEVCEWDILKKAFVYKKTRKTMNDIRHIYQHTQSPMLKPTKARSMKPGEWNVFVAKLLLNDEITICKI